MSAASTAPEPDDRRDDPVPTLSSRDERILDEIAGHENGTDPTFVARLREQPGRAASPATERALQVLAVGVVAAVLLPTAWLMVGVVLLVLIVLPGMLAWAAHRAGPTTRSAEKG